MIVQGFKVMTDFFETRVENLEPKEDKKKSSSVAKNQGQEIHQEN